MIKVGALLPAGAGKTPEPVFVDGYKDIQREVGGNFDVVRLNEPDSEVPICMVGYVNDEGIMLDLPMNYYASALFGKELFGDCVLMWGLSPNGEYDGDDYDLPDNVCKWLYGNFANMVRSAYNDSLMMAYILTESVETGLVTLDEANMFEEYVRASVNGEATDMPIDVMEIVNRIEGHVINKIISMKEDDSNE